LPSVLVSNRRFTNFYHITKPPAKSKKKLSCFLEPIQKIELQNIYFRYPNQKNYLLKNFSKTLAAGGISKLEGRNGTGKSTIILLILGLLKPQKGEIIINNHYRLQEIDLEY